MHFCVISDILSGILRLYYIYFNYVHATKSCTGDSYFKNIRNTDTMTVYASALTYDKKADETAHPQFYYFSFAAISLSTETPIGRDIMNDNKSATDWDS